MRIVEIFHSRQGEGRWTGMSSVFVRVAGCNLACGFCDTPYAGWNGEPGTEMDPEEIVGRALIFDCPHVVLTGGEPMLYAELVPLARLLKERRKTITIETAGTLDRDVCCDLMSISPKLANAFPDRNVSERIRRRHEANRFRPETVRLLIQRYDYQLKFVVDCPADFAEIESYLGLIPEIRRENVFLMPKGIQPEELRDKHAWIVPYCEQNGSAFSPRMQIEWYGNVRKK